MRSFLVLVSIITTMLISSCSNGQTKVTNPNLTAVEFAAKIKELPTATILDVRSSEEFANGHLENATNYNWNDPAFQTQIESLDKNKPVLVYCLSGGRSNAAANSMRSAGYTQVYELTGGIIKWRAQGLPEVKAQSMADPEMTKADFEALIKSDKVVLVDFYADWCVPCKKMKPYLDEIAIDMADKVQVIRINADDHQQLCKVMGVDALPVLQVYKNNQMTWSNTGFIDKAGVLSKLDLSLRLS